MRKLLILFVFLLSLSALKSQDKIITHQGDTILCKIVSVNATHISYELKTDNEYVVGKSILIENVKEYIRIPEEPSNDSYVYIKRKQLQKKPAHPLLFTLSPGGSYLPWLLDFVGGNYSNEYKDLNKGLHVNSSLHYLFNTLVGAGFQYSFFTSGFNGSVPVYIGSMYPVYSVAESRNRQYINYVGGSGILQQFLDKSHKFQLSETLSAGLVMYREESQTTFDFPDTSGDFTTQTLNSLTEGMTFGATLGISAEYYIQPKFSVGVSGDFMYAELRKASAEMKSTYGGHSSNSGKLSSPINLSKIDYSLFFRLHF